MSELPNGWASTTLSRVCGRGKYGWTTKAADEGDVKFLRTTDITKGSINWATVPYCAESPSDLDTYLLKPRDIVISRAGSVGFSALIDDVPEPAVFASYLIRFVPSAQIEARYIAAFLRSPDYWKQVGEASAGIALANVNASKLAEVSLPLAPIAEQKRIADKLEAALDRVDACRARLDRVPELLKRFRQSVLAAATSGQLSNEWRSLQKETSESQRIQVGEGAIEVPSSWEKATLIEVIDPVRPLCYGVVQPGEEVSGGSLLIRVQDMLGGRINTENLRTISKDVDAEYKRSCVKAGDLLISVVGTIGRTSIVPPNLEANIARAVARIACRTGVDSRWVNCWLCSDTLQWWLTSSSKEVARKTLNLSDLANAPVAIPPPPEQQEIVRRVEDLFAFARRIEARLTKARAQVERLTPATLAKAFRGELVPQDPNDEPASVLLERLLTAKKTEAAQPKRETTPHKSIMKSSTKESVRDAILSMKKDKFSFPELRVAVEGDYEALTEAVFRLLAEEKPILKQVFNAKARIMHFQRLKA